MLDCCCYLSVNFNTSLFISFFSAPGDCPPVTIVSSTTLSLQSDAHEKDSSSPPAVNSRCPLSESTIVQENQQPRRWQSQINYWTTASCTLSTEELKFVFSAWRYFSVAQMKITQEKLLALKLMSPEGKSMRKFVSEFDATNMFRLQRLVCLQKRKWSGQWTFDNLKARFHQALVDNIVRRFRSPSGSWGAKPKANWRCRVAVALFGDAEIAKLCKRTVWFSSNDAADIFEFSMFKKRCLAGSKLTKLMSLLSVYPISSTACGFSQMNLQQTSLRNSLQVETVRCWWFQWTVHHWSTGVQGATYCHG